ncbi:replication protein [Acinetobacter sp. ANC 4635]|nr:replication protein [Acinetobacter sp. ANC 4635]
MGFLDTPLNKMGVTESQSMHSHWQDADLPLPFRENPVPYEHMVMTARGPKPVQCRLPADNEIAVVDWLNFTDTVETVKFTNVSFEHLDETQANYMFALEMNKHIEHIFGLSLTFADKGMKNRYQSSYEIGDKCGFLCVGGQRNTYLVMLTGRGCSYAKEGWEQRLYTFLTNIAKRGKITRIDLAHDDFEGKKINVDWGNMMDGMGGFKCGNRQPNVEHKGNWKRPNGRGRTLNIGSRESGKYLRLYEKGRAEGDSDDNWQRAEVEFKAKDRVLPYDMLLSPSEYFIAAYPCFEFLAEDKQPTRIETMVKNSVISCKAALETIKHQFGRYINLFKNVYEPEELINLISHADPLAFPKRLDHVIMTAMRM